MSRQIPRVLWERLIAEVDASCAGGRLGDLRAKVVVLHALAGGTSVYGADRLLLSEAEEVALTVSGLPAASRVFIVSREDLYGAYEVRELDRDDNSFRLVTPFDSEPPAEVVVQVGPRERKSALAD